MNFNGIPWNFPWNSIEFYETEVDGISWNSVLTGVIRETVLIGQKGHKAYNVPTTILLLFQHA
jgi:hypothetical protein